MAAGATSSSEKPSSEKCDKKFRPPKGEGPGTIPPRTFKGHRGGRVREDPFLGCLDPDPFVQLFGGRGCGGRARLPTFQLRTVSPVSEDLLAVRPREHLLREGLRPGAATPVAAAGGAALPGELPRPTPARGPSDALSTASSAESDASCIPSLGQAAESAPGSARAGGMDCRRPREGGS